MTEALRLSEDFEDLSPPDFGSDGFLSSVAGEALPLAGGGLRESVT